MFKETERVTTGQRDKERQSVYSQRWKESYKEAYKQSYNETMSQREIECLWLVSDDGRRSLKSAKCLAPSSSSLSPSLLANSAYNHHSKQPTNIP